MRLAILCLALTLTACAKKPEATQPELVRQNIEDCRSAVALRALDAMKLACRRPIEGWEDCGVTAYWGQVAENALRTGNLDQADAALFQFNSYHQRCLNSLPASAPVTEP